MPGRDPSLRHGRACPGHPRLALHKGKDVDARHKAGHDREAQDNNTPAMSLLRCAKLRNRRARRYFVSNRCRRTKLTVAY
jgi:hypothetical protein